MRIHRPFFFFLALCLFSFPKLVFAQNPLDQMLGRASSESSGKLSDFQEMMQQKQRLEDIEKQLKEAQRTEASRRERLDKEAQRNRAQANQYRELPKQQQWRREEMILRRRVKIAEASERNETLLIKIQSQQVASEQSMTTLKELIQNYLKFREDSGKWLNERYPKKARVAALQRDQKRIQEAISTEDKESKRRQKLQSESEQLLEDAEKAFEKAKQKAEQDSKDAILFEQKQAEATTKIEQQLATLDEEDTKQKAAAEAAAAERRRIPRAEQQQAFKDAAERKRKRQSLKEEIEKQRTAQEKQRTLYQLLSLLNRTLLEGHRYNLQYLNLRRDEQALNKEIHDLRLRFYRYTIEQMKEMLQSIAAQAKGGLLYQLPISFEQKILQKISTQTLSLLEVEKNPLIGHLTKLSKDFQKTLQQLHTSRQILLGLYLLLCFLIIFLLRRWLLLLTQRLRAEPPSPSSPPIEASPEKEIHASPAEEDKNTQAPAATEGIEGIEEKETTEQTDAPSEASQAPENTNEKDEPSEEDHEELIASEGDLVKQAAGWRQHISLLFESLRRLVASGVIFAALLAAGWLFALPQRIKIILWTAGGMVFVLRALWVGAELFFAKKTEKRFFSALSDRDARTFRRILKGLALFSFLYYPFLQVVYLVDYPVTLTHILECLFVAGILLGVLYLFLKKDPILSLIPADNPLGKRILILIRRFYPVLYLLALTVFLIYVLGYHALAIYIATRLFLSIVILLSAYSIQQIIWTLTLFLIGLFRQEKGKKQRVAVGGFLRLLRLAVTGITILLTLSLLLENWGVAGGYKAILRLLDTPFFQIQGTQISVFSVAKLLFSVFGSLWLSSWLRQKLHEILYPALRMSPSNQHASDTILHYAIIVIGVLVGLQWMGIGVGVLAVFAGVIGIGIGFGTQDIANNFISGLIITFGKSIKVGDVIEIEDVQGVVREISARSTTLEAIDGRMILIPNASLLTLQVINWSIGPAHILVDLPVSVARDSDPQALEAALLQIAQDDPAIFPEPKPAVLLEQITEESLDFLLKVAIPDPLQRFIILSQLRYQINQRLPALGFTLLASKPLHQDDDDHERDRP